MEVLISIWQSGDDTFGSMRMEIGGIVAKLVAIIFQKMKL
jgi:hypothetical protein